MDAHNQSGFTIIEVLLFLSISALLFLIAIIGTGGTIGNVRFTDSVRSLESYVQKQYDDIVNGVNTRSDSLACTGGVVNSSPASPQAAGASNCILLGKVMYFTVGSSQIETYSIVGSEPPSVDSGLSDEQLVRVYNPKVVTSVGLQSYSIPWGATISGIKREDSQATDRLALIRSPKSTRVMAYTYKSGASLADAVNNAASHLGKSTNYCVKSADVGSSLAMIVVGGGSNQNAVQANFNAQSGDCNGI